MRNVLLAAATLFFVVPCSLHGQAAQAVQSDSLPDRETSQGQELVRLQAIVSGLTAQLEEQANIAETRTPTPDDEKLEFPVEVNSLVQAWFAAQGDPAAPNAFSLRRAEVAFSGAISPEVAWTIMVDPSKALALRNTYADIGGTSVITESTVEQGSHVLQDAFITAEFGNGMNLRFGQFHVPLSMEGLEGSGGLETVERALFATDHGRGGYYGDVRDIGVSTFGNVGNRLDYTIGVFNGLGTGLGTGGGKGVAGRFVGHPSAALSVGGSSAYARNPRRARYGADARFAQGPWVLKTEVIAGRDDELRRFGYYGLAALQIQPSFQVVARFDSWDPDTRTETSEFDAAERNVTAGISYLLKGSTVKLQANYVRQWFAEGLVPSQNLLRVNIQTAW